MIDLRETIKGCKRNSISNQMELFDFYAPKMKTICLRYLKHNHEAEEAMLLAFHISFSKINQLKDTVSVDAWLKKKMIETSVRILQNRLAIPPKEQETSEIQDPKLDLSKQTFNKSQLESGLSSIIGYQSIIFTLYFIDKYEIEEISLLLGFSIDECNQLLQKAKNKVAKTLIKSSKS